MNVECVVSIILDGDLDSNRMKKTNKGLIASLFEWIGFPWSKVR